MQSGAEESGLVLRPAGGGDEFTLASLMSLMDPEDAALAQESIAAGEGSSVLVERGGSAIGFLGVEAIEETEGSVWLNWGAFLPDVPPAEIAASVGLLEERLRTTGVTRLIAMEAAEAAGEQRSAYLAGLRGAGFEEAVRLPDFYMPGETAVYLVRRVDGSPASPAAPDPRGVVFTDIVEHEESDDSYIAEWAYAEGRASGKESSKSLARLVKRARKEEARMIVCSGPSNLGSLTDALLAAGFRRVGELNGFYAPGLHEAQFLLTLD